MAFQGLHWKQFAAVKLCMVPLNASLSIPWMPVVPWSHTSAFHCCSFSPFLVTEHLVGIREGATSAPCQCFTSHLPTHLWLLTQLHRMTITLRRASVSQVISVCAFSFPTATLVPSTPTLPPAPARSSLGVQVLLAMTSLVSLWQGQVHAPAQPP